MKPFLMRLTGLFMGLTAAVSGLAQAPVLSPPERDFEALWTTFRDHYAFFGQKQVDWDATYRTYRARVTAQTTGPELVAVFKAMLDPLRDGHITLARGEEMLYKGESVRSSFKKNFKPVQAQFWRVAYQQLRAAGFAPVTARGPEFKGVRLLYTTRSKDVGYLHLTRCFAGLKGVVGTAAQEKRDQQQLEKQVARALAPLADCRALIVDLRDNGGGHGGYELAGLFSDQRLLVNYKATRQPGAYDHFSPPEPYYLVPAAGRRYLQPVVVLTSDQTASAAEDFTLALARRPGVTLVGTATKGMLSDMYQATLPGGLQVTLSNQRYTSPEGQVLEDVGVVPTVLVENTPAELQQQRDPVLARALALLAQQP